MTKDFDFGREMQEFSHNYFFNEIAGFVNGKENVIGKSHFHELRPFFDKYGYTETLDAVREIAKEKEKYAAASAIEARPDMERAEEYR